MLYDSIYINLAQRKSLKIFHVEIIVLSFYKIKSFFFILLYLYIQVLAC